jgi:hypothetical protein
MATQARKEQAIEASEENTRDKILSAAGEVFAEQVLTAPRFAQSPSALESM